MATRADAAIGAVLTAMVQERQHVTMRFPGQRMAVVAVPRHLKRQLDAGRPIPFVTYSTVEELQELLYAVRSV